MGSVPKDLQFLMHVFLLTNKMHQLNLINIRQNSDR
jgi:hypothetical protein